MNRRQALKAMTLSCASSPLFTLFKNDQTDDLNGYTFKEEVKLKNGIWKIYVKQELGQPMLLNPKTFEPIRPCKPALVERRIGVREDGAIGDFPMLIAEHQCIRCYHTNYQHKIVFINT
jgi:hypothetical protein